MPQAKNSLNAFCVLYCQGFKTLIAFAEVNMNAQNAVNAFLSSRGLLPASPDIHASVSTLLFDMEEGLATKDAGRAAGSFKSSMPMIPTWTRPPESAPKSSSIIVIDAGGTNFRSSLVTFDSEGAAAISDMQKTAMPGIEREYSKAEFFEKIADNLEHLKNRAPRIAFCFSYAFEAMPNGDGRVIEMSKGVRAPEVHGCLLGENLKEALSDKGWTSIEKIIVANDTSAALLAGASAAVSGKAYGSYIGFILGTGINAAYIESGDIPKNAGIPEAAGFGPQIVVCESAKTDKMARSFFDDELLKVMDAPAPYERMCSGAFLATLGLIALKEAAKAGLFSPNVAERVLALESLELRDMDAFFFGPFRGDAKLGAIFASGEEFDSEAAYRILDALVDRAARLAAINIAAAAVKSGKGFNPARPICVLCEGTTFLKTHSLRDRVFAYLYGELTLGRGVWFELVSMENAVTLGTAIAGLL